MIKIAMICASELPLPAVKGGGAETLMNNLIDENEIKKELKIDVYSYYNSEALNKSHLYKESSFYYYKSNKFDRIIDVFYRVIRRITLRKGIYISCFLKSVCKEIKKSDVDLVVIGGNQMYVDYIQLVTKKPIVLHMHTDLLNNSTPNANRIVQKCDGIITISDYCKNQVSNIPLADPNRIRILKNTIDINLFNRNIEFNKNEFKNSVGINNDFPVLLFCGRLDEGKGVLQLVRALSIIDKKACFNLLIVGGALYSSNKDTDYILELKRICASFKNNVIFTGHINNNILPYYYLLSDLTIFPSICNEAAGLITIESLSMGTPVITTNKGGIPEYATGEACIIIPVDNDFINNLSDVIFKFLNDIDFKNKYTEEALNYNLTYTKKEYYKNFVEILRSFT